MTHPEMWWISMLLVSSAPLACHPRVVSAFVCILVSPFGDSKTTKGLGSWLAEYSVLIHDPLRIKCLN